MALTRALKARGLASKIWLQVGSRFHASSDIHCTQLQRSVRSICSIADHLLCMKLLMGRALIVVSEATSSSLGLMRSLTRLRRYTLLVCILTARLVDGHFDYALSKHQNCSNELLIWIFMFCPVTSTVSPSQSHNAKNQCLPCFNFGEDPRYHLCFSSLNR